MPLNERPTDAEWISTIAEDGMPVNGLCGWIVRVGTSSAMIRRYGRGQQVEGAGNYWVYGVMVQHDHGPYDTLDEARGAAERLLVTTDAARRLGAL